MVYLYIRYTYRLHSLVMVYLYIIYILSALPGHGMLVLQVHPLSDLFSVGKICSPDLMLLAF
jgi:hypothetical protein